MTFNNIPKKLVDDLCECMDRIETAIRTDEAAKERKRLLAKFRKEFKPGKTGKPQNVRMTGLHGEPLQEYGPQPVELNNTHYQLIRWLSSGTFMAVPTLAGHLGIKKESVYHYLSGLKKAGYNLEIRSTGNRKGGYRNIYRLAQSA
tara:strand:+ start:1251 stop:1688 length:438 start_codon:yes stop_codon:yes gene_type:complete